MIGFSMYPGRYIVVHSMSAARFALKAFRGQFLTTQQSTPRAASPCLSPALLEPTMAFPNRVTDPEVAAASGELVPAQYLPSLPSYTPDDPQMNSCPPSSPLMEKDLRIFPYNSFLIPKGGQPVSLPKTKRLSRWGSFQLWFNTYR